MPIEEAEDVEMPDGTHILLKRKKGNLLRPVSPVESFYVRNKETVYVRGEDGVLRPVQEETVTAVVKGKTFTRSSLDGLIPSGDARIEDGCIVFNNEMVDPRYLKKRR